MPNSHKPVKRQRLTQRLALALKALQQRARLAPSKRMGKNPRRAENAEPVRRAWRAPIPDGQPGLHALSASSQAMASRSPPN